MITTLTGANKFLVAAKLKQMRADFLNAESYLALEKIDASEAELPAILEAVQSIPFLAKRKMVILRSLSSNKSASEKIEQIISSTAETTDLIIVEPNIDRRSSLFKTLKTDTDMQDFGELERPALARWVVAQAADAGGKISITDANYLIERAGANQQNLYTELQKLLTYSLEVTSETIDLLTEKTPQSKIFDLLDAAFGGQSQRALALYADQRAQKVEPAAILALLTWQLQLIALACYGADRSAEAIAKDANLSPYPVSKAQSLAKKIGAGRLANIINEVFEIDYRSKSSGLDLDEAIKTLIASL